MAQDKTYLPCEVDLKHASACTWAQQLGQRSATKAEKRNLPLSV